MGISEQISEAQKSVINDQVSISVSEIVSMYGRGEIIIDPEFQRLFRWTQQQKSDLIESILVRIPVPPLFCYETDEIRWELVDGLQRLSTILEFLGELRKPGLEEKEPPSFLTSTTYLPGLKNAVWEKSTAVSGLDVTQQVELDRAIKLAIRRARIDFQILKQPSDASTKYDLFRRLNRGGVYATQQEVRSCLMVMLNSAFFARIKTASKYPSFVTLTGFSDQRTAEQADVEHVVRFIVHVKYGYDDKSDVQDFIDSQVESLMKEGDADGAIANFEETFDLILAAAGVNGLRANLGGNGGRYSLRSLEAVAVGVGSNLQAIKQLGNPKQFVLEKISAFWSRPEVEGMSASGLRGAQRLQRTISFGNKWFDPNADLGL